MLDNFGRTINLISKLLTFLNLIKVISDCLLVLEGLAKINMKKLHRIFQIGIAFCSSAY